MLPLEMPSFPSCISLFLQALPPNPWQVDPTHLLTLTSTRLSIPQESELTLDFPLSTLQCAFGLPGQADLEAGQAGLHQSGGQEEHRHLLTPERR